MSVQIVKGLLQDIQYNTTETNYLLVLTDVDCTFFPEVLKKLTPHFYSTWNQFETNYKRSNLYKQIKYFEFQSNEINFLISFSIDAEDKLLNYEKLFSTLDGYKNLNINLYIDHQDIEKYLHNYELFETDIINKFKKENLNIIIVNRYG